jgi:hypothetical protein
MKPFLKMVIIGEGMDPKGMIHKTKHGIHKGLHSLFLKQQEKRGRVENKRRPGRMRSFAGV